MFDFFSGSNFSGGQKSFRSFLFQNTTVATAVGEEEQERKKKKRKKQLTVLETEKVESELLPQLVEALDELEKKKKYVDIQVCPKCKSPLVRRVGSVVGDMSAHMGFTPPKYEC